MEHDDCVSDELWGQRCDVRYKAWVQQRYHRKKQRFWDIVDKLTKTATIALGATLFGQYVKDTPAVGVAVSALGVLALIFGYTDRRQVHKELAEQASNLIAAIELVPAGELTPAKTASWRSEFARLCAKAPPAQKWLTLICEREQATAEGHPDHVRKLWIHQRLLCWFW